METASQPVAAPASGYTATAVIMPTSDVDAGSAGSTANGSTGPLTVQDTSVRVVESVKNRVVTNKTIVQRTANTNAVQVNKYDADGNLKSSDIDSTSWEDRDTESYQWSNKEQPPAEALHPPATDQRIERFFAGAAEHQQQQQQQQPQQAGDGNQSALMLTTAERRDVPAVSWSGVTSNQQVDEAAGREQRLTTKMEGSQWSRSGEAVWISSSSSGGPAAAVSSSSAKTLPAIDAANGRAAATAAATTVGGDGGGGGALSVDERRRRRCMENRSRKAAATGTSNSTAAPSARVRQSPTGAQQ